MRKVYSFPGITSGVVQVPVGKSHVCINFAKGYLDKKKYRPAIFTTDDVTLQSIIENSSLFGSRIFLDKTYDDGNEGGVAVEELSEYDNSKSEGFSGGASDGQSYPDVTKWADAVKVLKSIPGVEMAQLRTKESAKKVAVAYGISFPNYSFD